MIKNLRTSWVVAGIKGIHQVMDTFNSSIWEQISEDLWSQPGLQNEFKDSQRYTEKSCPQKNPTL